MVCRLDRIPVTPGWRGRPPPEEASEHAPRELVRGESDIAPRELQRDDAEVDRGAVSVLAAAVRVGRGGHPVRVVDRLHLPRSRTVRVGVADHPPPPDGDPVPPVGGGEDPPVEGAAARLPAALPRRVRSALLETQRQPEVVRVERVGVPSHHVDVSHPELVRPGLQQVGTVDVPEEHLGRVVDVPGELPPEPAYDGEVVVQARVHRVRALLVLPPVGVHVVVGAV